MSKDFVLVRCCFYRCGFAEGSEHAQLNVVAIAGVSQWSFVEANGKIKVEKNTHLQESQLPLTEGYLRSVDASFMSISGLPISRSSTSTS